MATSLYIAAANLGVVAGASTAGVFIATLGLPGALWSGWLFATLSLVCVALKIWKFDRSGTARRGAHVRQPAACD